MTPTLDGSGEPDLPAQSDADELEAALKQAARAATGPQEQGDIAADDAGATRLSEEIDEDAASEADGTFASP